MRYVRAAVALLLVLVNAGGHVVDLLSSITHRCTGLQTLVSTPHHTGNKFHKKRGKGL